MVAGLLGDLLDVLGWEGILPSLTIEFLLDRYMEHVRIDLDVDEVIDLGE